MMATIIHFSTKIIALNVYAWEVVSSHPLDFLELMAITLIHLGSLNTFPVVTGLKSTSLVLTLGTIQAASEIHFAVCVFLTMILNNAILALIFWPFMMVYQKVHMPTQPQWSGNIVEIHSHPTKYPQAMCCTFFFKQMAIMTTIMASSLNIIHLVRT